MSYQVYINGNLIELGASTTFAQTKQVNDIANLTTRNSNYTQNIKVPKTANNVRIFQNAFLVGNISGLPYQKATAQVIDTDTGQHVVFNGWAVLIDASQSDYNITIYDGNIDFYRAIENVTLTEIGLGELNHIKDVDTIIQTWNDDSLPYRYILADYNGNNDASGDINLDFQVPSASVPYLWDKIFEYAGFTYSGEIFNHEDFKNLWVSYPKPVPTEEPIVTNITNQNSAFITNIVEYPNDGGVFYGSATFVNFLPVESAIDSAYYTLTTGILQAGVYRFNFGTGVFNLSPPNINSSRVAIIIQNALGEFVSTNYVNIANGNYIDLSLNVGDKIIIQLYREDIATQMVGQVTPTTSTFLTGDSVSLSIDKIEGYTLGFDEAFIDFKASDFVREVVVRLGLTLFKDKYTNNIKFLTLQEVLQGSNINDLSDKFNRKVSEKYTFGNYAKSNLFKYKHNDDGQTNNDGSFLIDNANLAEEITLLNSLIYTCEDERSSFLGGSNVYKIWDKEIKDDETVEYKGLAGRFYFLRADLVSEPIDVRSEILSTSGSNGKYYRESYFRLSFNEILTNWYAPIKSIFDKAKLVTLDLYLKPVDIYNFDFSRLIYIEQLGSYYFMNKIANFVKGKPVRCELIEVDYFTEFEEGNPVTPIVNTVSISNPVISDCEISFDVETTADLPVNVQLIVYAGEFSLFGGGVVYNEFILAEPLVVSLSGSTATFPITALPFNFYGYKFAIALLTENIFDGNISGLSEVVAIDGSCFIEPDYPETLTLNAVTFIGNIPNFPFADLRRFNLTYSYTGMPTGQAYTLRIWYYAVLFGSPVWGYNDISRGQGQTNEFNITTDVQGIYSMPTKFKIQILDVESNEITL